MKVTPIMESSQYILELAREMGAVQRQRRNGLDAATRVSSTIFGFWQDPDLTLGGLARVAQKREVTVSASAFHQRFPLACVELFHRVLQHSPSTVVIGSMCGGSGHSRLDRCARWEGTLVQALSAPTHA